MASTRRLPRPLCMLCKWREWSIEVSNNPPIFREECPFSPDLVMKVYMRVECDDFDLRDDYDGTS